jgi:hypothetical protein
MSSRNLHDLNWMLPVRIVQAVFAIIILGLTAYGKFGPDIAGSPVSLSNNTYWKSSDQLGT